MPSQSTVRLRWSVLPILATALLMQSGCNISFKQDPAETVIVTIIGIKNDEDRETIKETLKGMTDGSSHTMRSSYAGNRMTVHLSPVTNVKKFSQKINFGKVTEVKGRTVKVDFVK